VSVPGFEGLGVLFHSSASTRFAAKTYVFGYEAEGSRCVEENVSVAGFEGLRASLLLY
jgi:hypothetical protein